MPIAKEALSLAIIIHINILMNISLSGSSVVSCRLTLFITLISML
jgi:hypothetical protein